MPFWEKSPSGKTEYDSHSPSPDNSHDIVHVRDGEVSENADNLQRRLNNRQIQLIAIGGSIGTALFVSIGGGLYRGGAASLFIAYFIYSCMLALVNNCIAEMTTLYPVSGGFIRLAGHFVDDAFGFMAGWNFFVYEALLIPFEITALTLVLGFWSDNIPAWSIPLACVFLYGCLNILAVKAYGEAEFWLSGGKVILIFILFGFTFVTMVGGNPSGDAYGFRYWTEPAAFKAYLSSGSLGRFEGFLACLWNAAFTVVGPEYISMVSAEAKRPRIYIKNAFKTVYWRFCIFFILGSLCVGIVVRSDDPKLAAVQEAGTKSAAASPYVIAMTNMGVSVLPHIVNALMVTSIFSAGNTYTYCATRSLYGLALEGRAPKFLRYCTKNGVPLFCFCVVMVFPCLAFLQVSSASSEVLNWLIDLITGGGIINYNVMVCTYIFYHKATKAQGLDRQSLPYTGWFQPYGAYVAQGWMMFVILFYGYASFRPWDVQSFFIYYTMLILAAVTFLGWKIVKRTKFVKANEVDLIWERPSIDAYEATFIGPPTGFWREMGHLIGIGRKKGGTDARRGSTISA